MLDAIAVVDFTVIETHRDKETQTNHFNEGRSKVKWPHSKHNRLPSRAIDIAPWPIPIDWGESDPKEMARFYYLAGVVQGIASKYGIELRWGGDWDSDSIFSDNGFDDLLHFEMKDSS